MDRQHDPKSRASAQLRFDRNRPALHLDHALGDRQTQARPALLAGIGIVDLLEFAKDPFLIGVRVSWPASILARSSTSLINARRCLPLFWMRSRTPFGRSGNCP